MYRPMIIFEKVKELNTLYKLWFTCSKTNEIEDFHDLIYDLSLMERMEGFGAHTVGVGG